MCITLHHMIPQWTEKKTKKKIILATRTEEVDKIGEKSKNGIIIKTLTPTMWCTNTYQSKQQN